MDSSKSKQFRVAVVIPTFEAAAHVGRALDSLANLTNDPVTEILVADDASSDATREIVLEHARHDSRIRLIPSPFDHPTGPGATRNRALAHATAEWIAFLDADDEFLPHRFEADAEALADHARADARAHDSWDGCHNKVEVHFENAAARESYQRLGESESFAYDPAPSPQTFFEAQFEAGRGSLQLAGVTIRRELLHRVGGFDAHLSPSEDLALWYKIGALGRIGGASTAHPVSRYHVQERSAASRDPVTRYREQIRVALHVLRWGQRHGIPEARLRLLEQQFQDVWHHLFELRGDGRRPIPRQLVRLSQLVRARPGLLLTTRFWKDLRWSLSGAK